MKAKAPFVASIVLTAPAFLLGSAGANSNLRVPVSGREPVAAVDPSHYSGLVWRNIGPFRGGRVSAVCGAIGAPGVFYAGMPNGGLWKSTNAGITWESIFDSVTNASSVGSVQVAPSDPNIVYVGLGDGTTGGGHNEGDGVYKSLDSGKTWTHCGLDFAKQIPRILVDPHDPNIVLAAVLGDFHKPSPDRGLYRSVDGGKSWTKTLNADSVTGVQDLAWAFDNPSVVFATTARHCTAAPKETAAAGIFKNTSIAKSVDGGVTWKPVKGDGLPSSLNGRTSISVVMHTDGKRVFFVSNSGVWRTDDGGDTWKQMDKEDARVRNGQGGYNCGVYTSSKDPDTVYVLNTCSYISHDGGNTFAAFKGAPGGDDPQQLWVDPTDGQRLFMGVDQGPTVSLDGGKTWSGWYNVSNGQFYHIAVSNSWPYWIYGTMQDSGAIGMSSRGIYGEITPLDWNPNPGWEWGSITVDPLNSNTIYSTGQSNDVIKQSFPTGQWVSISPDNDPKLHLRHDFNQPIQFSPANPHELFLGYQFLMSSTDGGKSWRKLSPDLSFPKGYVPPKPAAKSPAKPARTKDGIVKKANEKEPEERDQTKQDDDVDVDKHDDEFGDQNINPKEAMEHMQELANEEGQRGGGGGAISSLSASSIDNGIIWAGISNGTIKLTLDHGKTWDDVNIPTVKRSIACIDASHTDRGSAYVAVATQDAPEVYRTKNFGKTWTKIVAGLPVGEVTGSWVNVIRADTKKNGLLFLGTETSMFVSFDDGDHWQSLKLNAPNTSYRDIVVKNNDLVVGTYGRSFWILDDITPLRQETATLGSSWLFAPGEAVRVRRNVNQDTPMPPEVPHALNAPPGAMIYYYLGSAASSDISIDVSDRDGTLIRHFTSVPPPATTETPQPVPDFWKENLKPLSREAGMHRITWDLRYENTPAFFREYDISATPFLTPASPQGPLVLPGEYRVTLTVDGQKTTQKVMVKNDPRSPGSAEDLGEQHKLQMLLYHADEESMAKMKAIDGLKSQLSEIQKKSPPKEASAAIDDLVTELTKIGGPTNHVPAYGFVASSTPTFGAIQGRSVAYLAKMEFGDIAPSRPIRDAVNGVMKDLDLVEKAWKTAQSKDLPAINALLSKAGLPAIKV